MVCIIPLNRGLVIQRGMAMSIPKIFHRTIKGYPVPEKYEKYWTQFKWLHQDWEFHTYTCPDIFMSDQVRLLAVIHFGGIYVDWDVEPMRPWDSLLNYKAFAARDRGWFTGDPHPILMNGVFGAEPGNQALKQCLEWSISLDNAGSSVQDAGCGAFNAAISQDSTWAILPTESFYPYDWKEPERESEDFSTNPMCFGVHHWATSWRGQPRGI
jgi:hypothetical protein